MNIVIDTNIFIAALITDGVARDLIVNTKHNLLFPEAEFGEIKKYQQEIMHKSDLSEIEFDILFLRLLKYVRVIPNHIICKYNSLAFDIIGNIHETDVLFIATALAFNCPVWSDDKHFKKQDRVRVLTTKDMIEMMGKD